MDGILRMKHITLCAYEISFKIKIQIYLTYFFLQRENKIQ